MLKKMVWMVSLLLLAASLTVPVAEAARLGGGRSFGVQRQMAPLQRRAAPPVAAPQQGVRPAPAPQPAAAPAQSGWRRWGGALAGLAAGIGLAALLAHFGVGSQFAGILLAVLAVVVVIALLKRLFGAAAPRQEPAYAGVASPYAREAAPHADLGGSSPQNESASRFPAGFDAEVFARQAKLNFIRLQAANDACNLADIREFTAPEVFAEIKLEIDERGGRKQRTDVVMLDAEVVEVVEENGHYIASVHYSGSLREEEGATPQPFDELWHLTKPVDGNSGWVLAGIQQFS